MYNQKYEKRNQNQRREGVQTSVAVPIKNTGTVNKKLGGAAYARKVVYHMNDADFIYKVNFQAGKG